jgi:predicted Fe-Mo cluster-binding NifX family protein
VAIAASSDGGLAATVDPRFGRAPFFIIVDPQSGEVLETVPNNAAEAAHGAGTGAAALMRERGVDGVVAGRIGPKALEVLQAMQVTLWTLNDEITVEQALERLRSGELARVS